MTFGQFIGIVIPLGIIIFIGIKIWNKMSVDNPDWFSNLKQWISEKTETTKTKIDPMHEGSIKYAPG
jgi:hypothetical protein